MLRNCRSFLPVASREGRGAEQLLGLYCITLRARLLIRGRWRREPINQWQIALWIVSFTSSFVQIVHELNIFSLPNLFPSVSIPFPFENGEIKYKPWQHFRPFIARHSCQIFVKPLYALLLGRVHSLLIFLTAPVTPQRKPMHLILIKLYFMRNIRLLCHQILNLTHTCLV